MEDKKVSKFINKIKDKLSKNKTTYPSIDEYAFSTEELKTISVQNKEKIAGLKQDIFKKNTKEEPIEKIEQIPVIEETEPEEIKLEENIITENNLDIKEEVIIKENIKEEVKEEPKKNSFINLEEEYQNIVMKKWNELSLNEIDKDIIDGKDLLNHNYTITYADDAAKFIHTIRKKYEVVICYLIGFNNEKKGIYEKTIFSNKMEEEWKYLNSYIKILEKIRNFRK